MSYVLVVRPYRQKLTVSGAVAVLTQNNIRRLLAYDSTGHVGYYMLCQDQCRSALAFCNLFAPMHMTKDL